MKAVINILQPIAEPLGWTLLNSLWQAGFVVVLVVLILRILPMRYAKTRYAIACAGILSIFISSAITFMLLFKNSGPLLQTEAFALSPSFTSSSATVAQQSPSRIAEIVTAALTTIDNNMPFLLIAWSLGALGFSLRLVSGWWFISALKCGSNPITDHWNDQLQALAKTLGITKTVELAESGKVTTPMVIGFLKPLVLVPTGMLSGLSTTQVETIFLHELAHIRRHDYIVNAAQAVVETVFFFNPFVWMLSNIVRREREYCCDDEVISMHGSSLEYAKALAQLEEWKLTKSTFALALAANKNQLLHRIKRIMEKTGEKYSTKDRLVPAVLLIVGLVCASWLTVQKKDNALHDESSAFSQDTTGKKKSSRTTIIRIDENGNTHEQVFESYDGDDEMAFWTPPVPPVPGVPSFQPFPSFPAFPALPAVPGAPTDVWAPSPFPDSIPGVWFHGNHNWEKFSEEFEKKFSEQFSEFYKAHEEDFDNMMREMEKRFKEDFDSGNWQGLHEMNGHRLHELAELGRINFLAPDIALDEAMAAQEVALASIGNIKELAVVPTLEGWSADLSSVENNLNLLNENFAKFNKSIKELLVKDGYLKEDEEIKSMKWDDDSIEINGKKIKKSDEAKYRKQHDAFFKEDFVPNRIE